VLAGRRVIDQGDVVMTLGAGHFINAQIANVGQ
jgi:hypothetical protein